MIEKTKSIIRKTPINPYLGYLFELYNKTTLPLRAHQQPDKKFVIFGRGRSGSTLLVSLMNSHGDIYCDDEILNRKVRKPLSYIQCRAQLGNKPVYGFKFLSYQLITIQGYGETQGKQFLSKLIEHDFKIIYLIRNSILRHALSNIYARERMIWHEHNGSKKKKKEKMVVNMAKLDKWFRGSVQLLEQEERMMKNLEHLRIEYERDLESADLQPKTFKRITSFLDIPYHTPHTDMKKITTKELSSFVENHQEVMAYVEKNGYQKYL